jgi:hypothetical protein
MRQSGSIRLMNGSANRMFGAVWSGNPCDPMGAIVTSGVGYFEGIGYFDVPTLPYGVDLQRASTAFAVEIISDCSIRGEVVTRTGAGRRIVSRRSLRVVPNQSSTCIDPLGYSAANALPLRSTGSPRQESCQPARPPLPRGSRHYRGSFS